MLTVWYEHNRVGDIATVQGRWQFQYSNEWLKHSLAFPLSPQFPLQEAPFMDSADDKRVEWFFENLLPEGGIREALARNASISDQDVLGLLTQYGEECAGALSLLPQGDEYTNDTQYESLTFDALRNYISNAEETPLLAANELLHMSLAGVQNKLGIRYVNGEIYLPINNTPSSHILKPDNDNKVFAFCPANEYFCMRLARQMQLPVPEVDLLHIPEAIYIIERFDRVVSDTRIRRLHQVDLCQLLNKWVGYKYESHGGVTFSDVFQSLENVFQPAVDKGSILRWIIFNYLIGNNDAHAKNISFMVSHRGISLAPFYDLLCVSTYLPNSDMAMSTVLRPALRKHLLA